MVDVVVTEAESGMILHTDVLGASGQVLLPAGTILSNRHIQLLLANGVQSLAIRNGSSGSETPLSPKPTAKQIEAHLDHRFRDNDPDNPVIKELTRICRTRMEA